MPGVAIHVFNKGIGGQDADEMTARMQSRREARARPPRGLAGRHQLGDPPRCRSTKFAEKPARRHRHRQVAGRQLRADEPAVCSRRRGAARRGGICARHGRGRQGEGRRPVPPLRDHARPGTTTACPTRSSSPTTACISTISARSASASCCRWRSSTAIDPKPIDGRAEVRTLRLSVAGGPMEAPFRRSVDLSRERRHLRSRAVRAEDPVSQAREHGRPDRRLLPRPQEGRPAGRRRAGRSRTSISRPTTAPISTRPITSIRR